MLLEAILIFFIPLVRTAPVGDGRGGRRCGVSDTGPASLAAEDFKWSQTDLSYSMEGVLSQDDLSSSDFRKAVRAAYDAYAAVSPLKFKEAPYGEGNMTLRFAKGFHYDDDRFDGPGGVLAHAYYPEDGRIHFDSDEDWTLMSETNLPLDTDYVDFQWVAMHEIGHALGLRHNDIPDSLMYPSYKDPVDANGNYEAPKLDEYTVRELQRLYGGSNPDNSTDAPVQGVSVWPVIKNLWAENGMTKYEYELRVDNNSTYRICRVDVNLSRGDIMTAWNLKVSLPPGASSSDNQFVFIATGEVRLAVANVKKC